MDDDPRHYCQVCGLPLEEDLLGWACPDDSQEHIDREAALRWDRRWLRYMAEDVAPPRET